jgi:tetratricopeptide (TPR) repeat protein
MLSPEAERVRRAVLDDLAPDGWRPLTCDIPATLNDAARLFGLAALALAMGVLRHRHHRRWLRAAILVGVGAVLAFGALGLAEVTAPAAKVPWMANRGSFPLVNVNHVAALLAAALPTILALAARRNGIQRAGLLALALAANVGLLVTVSRAGVVLGVMAQVFILWRVTRHEGTSRSRRMIWGGGAVLLVTLAGMGWRLAERIRALDSPLVVYGRAAAARDALALIRDHVWTGVGHGAFMLVFPRYSEMAGRVRMGFVENEYLQAFIDFGVPGALIIFGALVLAARHALPTFRWSSLGSTAAATGLAVLAVHNGVDFSLEGGGVAAVACALGVLAFPGAGPSLAGGTVKAVAATAVMLAVAAATPLGRTGDADIRAIEEQSEQPQEAFMATATEAFLRHPSDGYLADLIAARLWTDRDPRVGRWIDRALLLGPRDPFAHRVAAYALAGTDHPDQAALELRIALSNGVHHDHAQLCLDAVNLFGDDEDARLLVDALPPESRAYRPVLIELRRRGLWEQMEPVGNAALAANPEDVESLRLLLESEMHREDTEKLGERAHRLVALDPSPAAAVLASRALRQAGELDEAETLLTAALKRNSRTTGAALELGRLALQRGDVAHASEVLSEALARAVTPEEKVNLHMALAEVADHEGRTHRAEAERAEAARLQR